MPLKPYKRTDSPYWWIRGTHKGVSIYETTGILHAERKRPPEIVEDLIRKTEIEIEQFSIHGRSYVATFEDAAEIYLKQGGSPRFLDKLVQKIGAIKLKSIDQEFLNDTAAEMYPNCAAGTVNRQFFTPFIAVWNANTKGQSALCQHVQWQRLKVIKRRRADIKKATTYEDAIIFINALHKSAAEIMFFLLYSGCRPIEAILLDCDDILIEDRWMILNETKTDNPRGVPIHECLVPMLTRFKEHEGRAFRNSKGKGWPDNRTYSENGRILDQKGGQFQTPLDTAYEKTGIKINPYMTRHTVSTYLIHPGGIDKMIKDEILGHGDTRDVSLDYIHLPRQAHINAINKLPTPYGLRTDLF